MSMGVPVIASNIGGLKEMIKDGFNGLLFDEKNTDQLGVLIMSLVDNPNNRSEMGISRLCG